MALKLLNVEYGGVGGIGVEPDEGRDVPPGLKRSGDAVGVADGRIMRIDGENHVVGARNAGERLQRQVAELLVIADQEVAECVVAHVARRPGGVRCG